MSLQHLRDRLATGGENSSKSIVAREISDSTSNVSSAKKKNRDRRSPTPDLFEIRETSSDTDALEQPQNVSF